MLYYLGNPETEILNESARANTSGKYISLSQGVTHYEMEGADSAETPSRNAKFRFPMKPSLPENASEYPPANQTKLISAVKVKHCIKSDSTFLDLTRPA